MDQPYLQNTFRVNVIEYISKTTKHLELEIEYCGSFYDLDVCKDGVHKILSFGKPDA